MTSPSLAQQIAAVQWAVHRVWEAGKRVKMREAEINEMHRRLEAALETLKTLEFTREAAQ